MTMLPGMESPKTDQPKRPNPNPYAEAFRAAFDGQFPDKYIWRSSDFVQLMAWRRAYPGVTPERFADVAVSLWRRGQYCPKAALSIRGLCASWAQFTASLTQTDQHRRPGAIAPPSKFEGGFTEGF